MTVFTFGSPIGSLRIAGDGEAVTQLFFEGDVSSGALEEGSTPLLERAAGQVLAFLSGERTAFELPIRAEGAPFFRTVWSSLSAIPYGQTRTYGELAAELGKPGGARAVGMANNRNPLPLIIPCHRVVGRGGRLVGYRGGLAVKRRLLELEREVSGR